MISHLSAEPGHIRLSSALRKQPIFDLRMRLGGIGTEDSKADRDARYDKLAVGGERHPARRQTQATAAMAVLPVRHRPCHHRVQARTGLGAAMSN